MSGLKSDRHIRAVSSLWLSNIKTQFALHLWHLADVLILSKLQHDILNVAEKKCFWGLTTGPRYTIYCWFVVAGSGWLLLSNSIVGFLFCCRSSHATWSFCPVFFFFFFALFQWGLMMLENKALAFYFFSPYFSHFMLPLLLINAETQLLSLLGEVWVL